MPGESSRSYGSALPPDIARQVESQARAVIYKGALYQDKFNKIRSRYFYGSHLFPVGLGGVIAPGDYTVLTTVKGSTGQGYGNALTDRETNWPEQNRVPNTLNLVPLAIHCDVRRGPTDVLAYPTSVQPQNPPINGTVDLNVPLHPTDAEAVATGMVLGYSYLNQNNILIGKLCSFPAPGGVFGFQGYGGFTPGATPGASAVRNDDVAQSATGRFPLVIPRCAAPPHLERRYAIPMLLRNGDTFNWLLHVPKPGITLLGVNTTEPPDSNDASGAVEVLISMWCLESYIQRG